MVMMNLLEHAFGRVRGAVAGKATAQSHGRSQRLYTAGPYRAHGRYPLRPSRHGLFTGRGSTVMKSTERARSTTNEQSGGQPCCPQRSVTLIVANREPVSHYRVEDLEKIADESKPSIVRARVERNAWAAEVFGAA